VQHYWSLSVEEQFYVVWPLLLALVAWGVRRWGWRIRSAMGIALGAVAVPSFAWCLYQTTTNQPFAFFDTGVRMWELSLGGLIAIGASVCRRVPRWVSGVGAAAGVSMIVLSAAMVRSDTDWPGALALAPTVGSGLLIAAGTATATVLRPNAGVWRPLVWVGGLSYSLYLWHWALLSAVREIWGPVSVLLGLAVVTASFLPAWLTHRFIENPVRFSPRLVASPHRSIALGLGLSGLAAAIGIMVAVVGSGGAAPQHPEIDIDPASGPPVLDLSTVDPTAPLGAVLLWPDPAARWDDIPASEREVPVPHPELAVDDRPNPADPDCAMVANFGQSVPAWCIAGDTTADRRIVVVGDSKATQWYSALNQYGISRGWRVEFAAKASCAFSEATLIFDGDPYNECDAWNRSMVAAFESNPPDVLITSAIFGRATVLGSTGEVPMTREAGIEGFSLRWAQMEADGIDVIALLDTPLPPKDIADCVERNIADVEQCSLLRESAVAGSGGPSMLTAAAQTPGVDVVDLTDYFCNDYTCPPVIGNVVVYRGGYHITDTYVRTLAPILAWRLDQILGAL
jgi:hypothetical protein